MRYIFLDVDGVLNSKYTKNIPANKLSTNCRCGEGYIKGLAALDYGNIAVFRKIMDMAYERYGKNNVKIVLSSSWRGGSGHIDHFGNYRYENAFRLILDEILKKFDLYIDDEIPELSYEYGRGAEIVMYLNAHKDEVDGYLVLDDHFFDDYRTYHITRHWVQSSYESASGTGGLQEKHKAYAMRMLDKKILPDERKQIGEFALGE